MGWSGNSSSKLQNKQIEAQYDYDKKVYDFNWASQAQVDASLADDDADNDLTLGQNFQAHNHAMKTLANNKANDLQNITYQNETARRNYDYNVSIQDFQYNQGLRAYNKSQQTYGKRLAFNQKEQELALASEDRVLEEQFLSAAFDNQSLIQGLFEATGTAGYEKAFTQIDQASVEGQSRYQQSKQLLGLEQNLKKSEFQGSNEQLNLIDQYGKAGFNKSMVSQDLLAKEGQKKYDKFGIGLDVHSAKTQANHENELLRRELSNQKAQSAYENTERTVKALREAGQAQLGQAGRSRGKIIQDVFAQIGRQNAYAVETMMRGSKVADARMAQNMYKATNTESKAVIASDKLDLDTINNIVRTGAQVEDIDRDLKIQGTRTGLNLDKIKQEVLDMMENTNVEYKEIERNLSNSITKAGTGMKKVDWDLGNTGSRFKQNQGILKANLDSAVKASIANKAEIALSKMGADMSADAQRLLRPGQPPLMPPPLNLPVPTYTDPLTPTQPPEPIEGAKANTGLANAASSVVGGAVAGLGAAAAVGATSTGMVMGMGATPWGLAIGLGSMLFG